MSRWGTPTPARPSCIPGKLRHQLAFSWPCARSPPHSRLAARARRVRQQRRKGAWLAAQARAAQKPPQERQGKEKCPERKSDSYINLVSWIVLPPGRHPDGLNDTAADWL